MDEIVAAVGRRGNCTFCGVFRRQALDRGAALLGANKMARPRRASPAAAPSRVRGGRGLSGGGRARERRVLNNRRGGRSRGTTRTTWRRRWRPARSKKLVRRGGRGADGAGGAQVLLNILRGDVPRLQRCAAAQTGSAGALPRSKPLRLCYEKEIVLYAHFRKLHYFRHPAPRPSPDPAAAPSRGGRLRSARAGRGADERARAGPLGQHGVHLFAQRLPRSSP